MFFPLLARQLPEISHFGVQAINDTKYRLFVIEIQITEEYGSSRFGRVS
jgi:hypothetical protein